MQQASRLSGGFDAAATDAAHAFRAVMEAMARPGTIHTLSGGRGPAPMSPAAATLVLTLLDGTTPIFLGAAHDTEDVRGWITFQTGAPIAARGQAQFALGTWRDLAPPEDFPSGTPEYPDRSATLIVEMEMLQNAGSVLRGPGIRDSARLNLPDPEAHLRNRARFPLGFDCCFTAGDRIAALPRSVRVRAPQAAGGAS